MAARPDPAADGSSGDETVDLSDKGGKDDPVCLLCCEEKVPLYTAPCEHKFCHQCIISMFRFSLRRNDFPVKCCTIPLPTDVWIRHLPKDLARIFRRKEEESCTPNPTRCHRSECDTFIPPGRILQDIRNCPKCGQDTCEACKLAAHDGPCQDAESKRKFLEWAEDRGWKQCPACTNVIELSGGCYHMVCRCKYEFCMLCGAKYGCCECELPNITIHTQIIIPLQIMLQRVIATPRTSSMGYSRRFPRLQRAEQMARVYLERRRRVVERERAYTEIQVALRRLEQARSSTAAILDEAIRSGETSSTADHDAAPDEVPDECTHSPWDRIFRERDFFFCRVCLSPTKPSIFQCIRCGLLACHRCRQWLIAG